MATMSPPAGQGSANQSAKIYQFPVGGRAALNGRDAQKSAIEIAAARISKAVASSGWYHEAAVTDDRTSKPQ